MAFVLLAAAVEAGLLIGLDAAAQPLVGVSGTVGASVFAAVTRLGGIEVVLPAGILLAGALIARRPGDAALVVLAVASSRIATATLKIALERPRPPLDDALDAESTFAFPSGHSSAAAALYGAVAVLVLRSGLSRRLRLAAAVLLGALIAAVAFSRVYLGVHYPTDVIGGLLIGFACLAGSAALVEAALSLTSSQRGRS